MPSAVPFIGHERQRAELQADLEQGNVAHAYLFSGPRHLGKFTLATQFAHELLCVGQPHAQHDEIRAEAQKLLHPDVLVLDQLWIEDVCEDASVIAQTSNITQQHRVKAKTKTDVIGIEDIRSLQERMHEMGSGKHRCCLIRSVERMQAEAVNALLKILEEPPQGVVFLLTTQSLSSLLPTLISRTRVLHFSRLADSALEPLLKTLPDDDHQLIMHIAQGAPGVAITLRDDPEQLRRARQASSNALAFWHAHSPMERLQLLAPLHEKTAEADEFLLHLSLTLREERDELPRNAVRHLSELARNMETNVHRQLLTQQFVLALGEDS